MNETDLDEALAVDVREGGHDELAVHAVRHAAVARNEVVKVLQWVVTHPTPVQETHLDEEGALQTAGKEASEGRNEGREERHGQGVEDDGIQHHSCLHTRGMRDAMLKQYTHTYKASDRGKRRGKRVLGQHKDIVAATCDGLEMSIDTSAKPPRYLRFVHAEAGHRAHKVVKLREILGSKRSKEDGGD